MQAMPVLVVTLARAGTVVRRVWWSSSAVSAALEGVGGGGGVPGGTAGPGSDACPARAASPLLATAGLAAPGAAGGTARRKMGMTTSQRRASWS
jgi:hypothetical protein